MPIRWSALKVSQSLNELESLLKAVEPKLRECEAKATETTKIVNLPEYMTQPLMSFTYIIDRAIDGLYGRISSARKYIPVEVLEREQAEFNKLLAFFNGDTAKAEMTMNLGKPSRKETPKEQLTFSTPIPSDKQGLDDIQIDYNPVGEAIGKPDDDGCEGGESDELLSEV